MKKATAQKNGGYSGLTTIMLDSLAEANDLVRKSMFYQTDYDEIERADAEKEFNRIVKSNPFLEVYYSLSNLKDKKGQVEECFRAIEKGSPKLNAKVAQLADELKDLALDIEPSLKLDKTWRQTEDGPIADAGMLAAGEERPCFHKHSDAPEMKEGKGEGAYRVVINTDVAWCCDPCVQAAALSALVMILQKNAPVEIWVQQGWLGGGKSDGVTLFPVHRGGPLTPQNIVFWIGHPLKDCVYSFLVNRMLGRRNGGVSQEVELPCDLYIYGNYMPAVNLANKDAVAKWVAATSRKMMFEEESPENFGE